MTTTRIFFRKALVGWLAYAMTFGPGTPAALAQVPDAHLTSNDYSNVPLPAKKRPNPNLIFSIDDSGSMDGEIAINANDGAAWYYTAGLTIGCATVAGKSSPGLLRPRPVRRRPGHGQQPVRTSTPPATRTAPGRSTPTCSLRASAARTAPTRSYADDQNDHFAVSPSQQFGSYRNPEFNKQYYNPTIVYQPWKPYNDGTSNCKSGTANGSGSTLSLHTGQRRPEESAQPPDLRRRNEVRPDDRHSSPTPTPATTSACTTACGCCRTRTIAAAPVRTTTPDARAGRPTAAASCASAVTTPTRRPRARSAALRQPRSRWS